MTTTAEHTFEGTIEYAFLSKTNKYDKFSLNFFPKTDDIRRAVKATGTRCSVKEDKSGKFFYTLTAPKDKRPTVVDAEGSPVTDIIGNGSEARIRLVIERFTSPTWGEVTRTVLTDVVIDKLIPYEKKTVESASAKTDERSDKSSSPAKMPF